MKNVLSLALLVGLTACADAVPDRQHGADFRYIEIALDGLIRTTNRLRLDIAYPGARLAGPLHRRNAFNGHPFEISLAALIGEAGAVIVHAERVADASGASDYDALPPSDWPNDTFRKGEAACVALSAADIKGEHDLEWLAANGFDPAGAALIQQYYATTDDHNDEVVLTLMRKVESCAGAGAPETALSPLREQVSVSGAA